MEELVGRYQRREFGLPSKVQFEQSDPPLRDAWNGLLERRWVTPVGQGHVILRGPAAQLAGLIESKVDGIAAKAFQAEREAVPGNDPL